MLFCRICRILGGGHPSIRSTRWLCYTAITLLHSYVIDTFISLCTSSAPYLRKAQALLRAVVIDRIFGALPRFWTIDGCCLTPSPLVGMATYPLRHTWSEGEGPLRSTRCTIRLNVCTDCHVPAVLLLLLNTIFWLVLQVTFGEGRLGFTLCREATGPRKGKGVVCKVHTGSTAHTLGVAIGDIAIGANKHR